jgi:hypothetical protein
MKFMKFTVSGEKPRQGGGRQDGRVERRPSRKVMPKRVTDEILFVSNKADPADSPARSSPTHCARRKAQPGTRSPSRQRKFTLRSRQKG